MGYNEMCRNKFCLLPKIGQNFRIYRKIYPQSFAGNASILHMVGEHRPALDRSARTGAGSYTTVSDPRIETSASFDERFARASHTGYSNSGIGFA